MLHYVHSYCYFKHGLFQCEQQFMLYLVLLVKK